LRLERRHAGPRLCELFRLFDRRLARWTDDPVHEHVVTDAPVARLRGDLLHASAESLEAYIAKQNHYTTLQAQALRARGAHASAAQLIASPIVRFFRFYVVKLGFLDGWQGYYIARLTGFSTLTRYVKIREGDEKS